MIYKKNEPLFVQADTIFYIELIMNQIVKQLMSTTLRHRFRDLDLLLESRDKLIITVLGMILTYIFGVFRPLWFDLEIAIGIPVAPTILLFNYAVLIFVIGYTKNLGSTLLMVFSFLLGMTNAFGSPFISFFESFFIVLLLTSLIVGILIAKFSSIQNWIKFIIGYEAVIIIFSFSFAHFARIALPKYRQQGINVGVGGAIPGVEIQMAGGLLPTMDIAASVLLLIILIIVYLKTSGERIYSSDTGNKLFIIGTIAILFGFLVSLVGAFVSVKRLSSSQMAGLAQPNILEPLFDLFTHTSSASVIVDPFNIYYIIPITTLSFGLGTIFRMLGRKKDTLAWVEGGFDIVLFFPAFFLVLFIVAGLQPLQNLAYPGGTYIDQTLYPIYFNEIWMTLIWNVLFAWIGLQITAIIANKE